MSASLSVNVGASAELRRRAEEYKNDLIAEIVEDAKRYAPVDTGRLRNSIHREGDSIVVSAPYAGYVEFGTRNMAPQPFLRPALFKNHQTTVVIR